MRSVIHIDILILTLLVCSSLHISLVSNGSQSQSFISQPIIKPYSYNAIDSNPFNVKEQMKLSPLFTPDNALNIYVAWIKKANTSIDIQNPYITRFDSGSWSADSNPIVKEIVAAANRNVIVRIQVNEAADSDNIAAYLNPMNNIEVRYMGSSLSSSDGSYLSTTHDKLMVIDGKVTLLSSINFSKNAFLNNREAGMVIQSTSLSTYYLKYFNADWNDGQILTFYNYPINTFQNKKQRIKLDYTSPTNIPKQNFTGIYNVTAFTNPDSADTTIFNYLKSAKHSIYVSMYTISRTDFTDTLIGLKKANPSMDIQVLISRDRVGASEDTNTIAAAKSLVANLIPVYNSTSNLHYYHNKYWIIDGEQTFIYSGNWSPASVTPKDANNQYTSGPNRDMGIAILNAPDIANFIKTQVWDKDVAVASSWQLPVGIQQTNFVKSDIVSGKVKLNAIENGLNVNSVNFIWTPIGSTSPQKIITVNGQGTFSSNFDTSTLPNGIYEYKVEAKTNTQTFTDSVKVNVVNYAKSENWRLLITEVHPNPNVVSDAEGEFFEVTNSFPFPVLVDGWSVGDNSADQNLFTFGLDYQFPAYTSLIFARNMTGFKTGFGINADFQVSIALSNTGDYIQLRNSKGDYMDVVAYGSASAPDGSQTNPVPGAGKSLSRTVLYIDTNTVNDFSITGPSPKANVPHVPLNTGTSSTSTGLPFTVSWLYLVALFGFILPLRRKKLLGKN